MKTIHWLFGSFLLLVLAAPLQAGTPKAKAVLFNTKGEKVGHAALKEVEKGVKIKLVVSHLEPGTHAFHIHEKGKCEPPDFKSAGGHFNPTHKKHGVDNPKGHHAGDLPNLLVGQNGKGKIKFTAKEVTLGKGENSLFHERGTAIVIHAGADDNKTDPAGNAGDRIACGVIEKD